MEENLKKVTLIGKEGFIDNYYPKKHYGLISRGLDLDREEGSIPGGKD